MQKQQNKKTIQSEIEIALNKLNISSKIEYAGRTDKGVHALNQAITFIKPTYWENEKLIKSLNKIISPYIYIKNMQDVPSNFHPRFSAKKRSYRYIITQNFSPFYADYYTYYPNPINLSLLKSAIKEFIGQYDFNYFCKTGSEVNSTIRTIYKTKIITYKNLTIFKFIGNGFLRSQIRIMINFLLQINEEKLTIHHLKEQLNLKKLHTKHLAPPNGLYLERIWY